MAFDYKAAKEAGYTDEEIRAYLRENPQVVGKQNSNMPAPVESLEAPPPTTVVPEVGTSAGAMATTIGLGAAPYIGSAALGAGALYGGNVLRQGIQAARENAAARTAAEQGIQQRFEQRMAQQAGQQAAQAVKPVAPSGIVDASGRPIAPSATTAPVAPSSGATSPGLARTTPVPQQGYIDKVAQTVRQAAANKALQNIAGIASKGSIFATGMTPTELGPATPQTGRMRGMEINPMTKRPWTKQEIEQYERNPQPFDISYLGAPQLRR